MNPAKEKLILEYLLSNSEAFALVKGILEDSFFTLQNRNVAKFMLQYATKYNAAPSFDVVNAECETDLVPKDDGMVKLDWIIDETEKFCRLEKTIQAIELATDLISNGDLEAIIEPIKKAVLTSLNRDIGLDYFANPKQRLELMLENSAQPTGFRDLDYALFGGIDEGGVNIIAANSGGGKSFWLANCALNWVEKNKNVIYISLELNQSLVAKRFDAMISHVNAREIFDKIDEVDFIVRDFGKNNGKLTIKFFPPQTKIATIEAYLVEFMIKTGTKPDMVVLDYLDLLMPNQQGVDINDQFLKDKFVTEDLRAMMHTHRLYGWTASQLNRSGVEAEVHTQANIAGGISKINTADIVATIKQSQSLKEQGFFEILLLKTRNSTGIDKTIRLAVEPGTFRLSDLPLKPEADTLSHRANSSSNSSINPRLQRLARKGR